MEFTHLIHSRLFKSLKVNHQQNLRHTSENARQNIMPKLYMCMSQMSQRVSQNVTGAIKL